MGHMNVINMDAFKEMCVDLESSPTVASRYAALSSTCTQRTYSDVELEHCSEWANKAALW